MVWFVVMSMMFVGWMLFIIIIFSVIDFGGMMCFSVCGYIGNFFSVYRMNIGCCCIYIKGYV